MLGHCLHSARLLAIVFRWKNVLVKVDLTPTVEGGEWKGVRKVDPLYNVIEDQHYFILPGSDEQPPIECQPTLKPDTSYAEQNTLDNMPPLLKDAITLLKILINPCFTPDVCPNSPKGTKPTSYNLKDGCYWTLFMNGEHHYDIDDYNIKHIVAAAVDILSNIKKCEYFEIEKKDVKCHKAIRNIYKTLLLGRPTTDSRRFLSLFPQSREKMEVPRDVKSANPQERKHKDDASSEKSKSIPDLSLPEYKPVGVYRINLLKSLGEGSFGKVFEAIHSTNYRKVAAKEIILKFKENVNKRLKREAMILSKLSSHLNIVKYIDHIEIDNHVWIITELCDDNLNEFCSKNEPSKKMKLDMMKQMARAVHHLHTCKPRVAHRDLKPSNILVMIGEKCHIKITDFGLSKHADSSMSSMNTYAGTVAYMAPEVHREQSHDVMVDVFSLGLVFEDFIIVSFRYLKPLQEDGKPLGSWMVDIKNKTGEFPRVPINFNVKLSSGLKVLNGLIVAMLSGEAADRPTMELVLKELDRVDHLLHGEQLSGASCTDEQCSDGGITKQQSHGNTARLAGLDVNYTYNGAQFLEPSNPSMVESHLEFLDLEISSLVTGQTFSDAGANDIDEPQNHKWLKEIKIEGYREWRRRMARDRSKAHQRAVLLFVAAHPEITGTNVCNGCRASVTNQYRCLQCLNVDLCVRCYAVGVQPEGHTDQHQMINLDMQCAACHGYIVASHIHCDQCGVDLCVDCHQSQPFQEEIAGFRILNSLKIDCKHLFCWKLPGSHESGEYCNHLDPNSTQRIKQRKWPFTMRRIVQYLDLAITVPPRSVSTNQENGGNGAVDGNREHKVAVHVAAATVSGSGAEALVLVGSKLGQSEINIHCHIRVGLGWQRLTATQKEPWDVAVCGVGTDGFIVVGGHDGWGNNKIGDCQQYSMATGEWTERADMPTGRSLAGCVSDGYKVWCMGGNVSKTRDVVPSDACEVLDLSTDVWERLPSMLQRVFRPIVCLLDRTILVLFNDYKSNRATMRDGVRTLQALPCDGGAWSHRQPIPDSVLETNGASAAAHAGCMYVVGGADKLCERYDPTTDSWTHLSPPPNYHHYGAVAAMAGGRLILAGGHTPDHTSRHHFAP